MDSFAFTGGSLGLIWVKSELQGHQYSVKEITIVSEEKESPVLLELMMITLYHCKLEYLVTDNFAANDPSEFRFPQKFVLKDLFKTGYLIGIFLLRALNSSWSTGFS